MVAVRAVRWGRAGMHFTVDEWWLQRRVSWWRAVVGGGGERGPGKERGTVVRAVGAVGAGRAGMH